MNVLIVEMFQSERGVYSYVYTRIYIKCLSVKSFVKNINRAWKSTKIYSRLTYRDFLFLCLKYASFISH